MPPGQQIHWAAFRFGRTLPGLQHGALAGIKDEAVSPLNGPGTARLQRPLVLSPGSSWLTRRSPVARPTSTWPTSRTQQRRAAGDK
jgi:hypothetical protein